MTTSQFGSSAPYSDQADWSRRADTLRSSVVPSVFDPSLLNDLAEGLEFLHRQLDDSEAELDRSREQSRAFEHDARRWEQEASRLRSEAEETRQALLQLRQDFDQSRDGSREYHETIERIVEEMAEMRAARTHLETLAAEQQRALVLSLELLRRVSTEEHPQEAVAAPSAEHEQQLAGKDSEIADLRRLIQAAGEEGTKVDAELATTREQLQQRNSQWEAAQDELLALRSELEAARRELDATKAELEATTAQLTVASSELASAQNELAQAQQELAKVSEREPETFLGTGEWEEEKARLAQKIQDVEAEIALQNAEVDSRGAIIVALENALEEQNTSLRTLEERFLAYAEQVQSLQLERLEMPARAGRGFASKFMKIFSPPKRGKRN